MFKLWKKYTKSIDMDELHHRAKNNDVDAQYELSLVYYRGVHVPKNMSKSNYWFEKANEIGKRERVNV
jgi:TPR repeat protein